ncbi:MAG: N-acetylmuramoyl-L-alanine amidase [Sarcina sp.]
MAKVFLDPGHGGADSGAVGVNNTLEKTINLQVAKKVEELLKKQGIEVKLSRTSDGTLSLKERTDMANAWKADCFLSIHCNAFTGSAKGVETYSYTTSTSNLAIAIHNEILKTNAFTLNRGTKTANFYVIKHTNMRASLVELAFIDNKEDIVILTTKQDQLALGIAKGICNYLGIVYKPVTNPPVTPVPPIVNSNTFYRVVCGSFTEKVNAEERIEELKKQGFDDAFIAIYEK